MSKRIRRKTFSKERIVMVASSVLVLSALTVTGLWMGSDEDTDDGGYVVDLTSIENKETEQNVAGQQVQVVGDVIRNTVPSDDLDYDPYFQETNSAKVENPDVSQSESMSAKEEDLLPKAEESVAEEAEIKEEEDAPALSTAMLPSLNYEEGDALVWPVVGNVLINYSMDKTIYFPTLDQYKYNPAIVIQANEGDMITAAAAGKVTSVFQDAQIGTAVTMDIGNGYEVTYGQLANVLVSEGSYVSAGDMIAQVAAPTRYYSVEGTNVYFMLTKDGEPINPMSCLN
ncbi:MAG: M23 family metallopeptidase [Lachnospiraceae bacterium]|nr:M23 family metallopeptidase [Lachnospiraceae bacterium]